MSTSSAPSTDVAARSDDESRRVSPRNEHGEMACTHLHFFSASQHPTYSKISGKLAIKYIELTQMWSHGISVFRELIQNGPPGSTEYMLNFIYLSFLMVMLLEARVPSFTDTWTECLGNLSRCRKAIQDPDSRDHETWSDVAKMRYNEVVDNSPEVRRVQQVITQAALLNDSAKPLNTGFREDENVVKSQRQGNDLTIALQDEGGFGVRNADLLSSSMEKIRCRWVLTKIAVLSQFMLDRFWCFRGSLLSTSICVFCVSMKGVLGQEMEVGRVDVPNTSFNGESRSVWDSLAWWILWMVVVLLVPVISPWFKFPNETGTSFILAFVSAISKSAVGSTNGPNFWAIISSGISFGSSIWLGTATMSRDNSVFVHISRYFGLAVLLYNVLCNSKLGDQERRLDLSITLPELSVLGSVLINALYNEKMKQLVELMESSWNAILAMLRLQRIPIDDVERSPRRSDR